MKIKERNPQTRSSRVFAFARPVAVIAVAGGLMLSGLLTGVIFGQRFQQTENEARIEFITEWAFVKSATRWFSSFVDDDAASDSFTSVVEGGDIPVLALSVPLEDAGWLDETRNDLVNDDLSFLDRIAATVTYDGVAGPGLVRVEHTNRIVGKDSRQFRVQVTGESGSSATEFTYWRADPHESIGIWTWLEALRREGLFTVSFSLAELKLNEHAAGLHVVEQCTRTLWFEESGRAPGPLIPFDEALFAWSYAESEAWLDTYGSMLGGGPAGPDEIAAVEAALRSLELFRSGKLSTTEVFDAEKLAIYVAMGDLSGEPAIDWSDLTLYFDSIVGKLEPVVRYRNLGGGRSGELALFGLDGGIRDKQSPERDDALTKKLFEDPAFFAMYLDALRRFSDPEYLDGLYAAIAPRVGQLLWQFESDESGLTWNGSFARGNQSLIRRFLSPEQGIHSYHHSIENERLILDIGNIQSLPVEVIGVSYGGAQLVLKEPILLPSKRWGRVVEYANVEFALENLEISEYSASALRVNYRILGDETLKTVPVFPWRIGATVPEGDDWLTQHDEIESFAFVSLDESRRSIILEPGSWTVERNLVLPTGWTVRAGPGLRLDLTNGAKIFSYSPLEFVGSELRPIVIESSDGTGQGLIVLGSEQPSRLTWVIFDNLGYPRENGWQVPGSVTFYESPVELVDVQFRNARAEDALNIMRTRFEMTRTVFSGNLYDAFDGDFTEGTIRSSAFLRCGNDAIDVSGSTLTLEDVRIEEIGDKALSAGEDSVMAARRVHIANSEIAVASKDLSSISAHELEIVGGGVAFTAYRKKPEFGEASIEVRGLTLQGMREEHLIEEGSHLTMDDVRVDGTLQQVESLLYGAQFGAASVER